ncbi:DNA polymerase III subunit delta' [Photobacterium nomapromontoriensis]|uniref:DNA polymerase III subunit delta' n=1 Tax=Photobacterium nomapromontoriensis TaxID=2910237 RepID=UPI003D0E5C29
MLYPWQESLWHNWQQLLAQGRLHHAVLLLSPLGGGQNVLAMQLAKTVLCQHSTTEPCGMCHSCRLFAAGTHPDFHHLAPVHEGKQIGVDAVRQSNRWAVETSQLGGNRIILIEQADAMGEAAANALLKTLEEPPAGCQYILLATSLDNLLPTINSRCNKWRLTMPSESDARRWVERQLMQTIRLETVRLNGNAPLATLKFIEQGQDIRYTKLLESFTAFVQPPFIGLYDVAGLCTAEGFLSLKWLSYFMVDCMKLQQGVTQQLVHCESVPLVQQAASVVSPMVFMTQIRKANELCQQLERHSGLNTELLVVEWLTGFINP